MNDRWLLMTVINLSFPLILIGFGTAFIRKPPKNRDSVWAYRTELTTINDDTWKTGHEILGKAWLTVGIISFVLMSVLMAYLYGKAPQFINFYGGLACAAEGVILLLTMIPVEKKMKQLFTPKGKRREPKK